MLRRNRQPSTIRAVVNPQLVVISFLVVDILLSARTKPLTFSIAVGMEMSVFVFRLEITRADTSINYIC